MLSGIPIPKDAIRPPETVLVNITPQETRVAVLEENNICELHIERNSGHSLVGNIYLGVVRRVLPGMQSVHRHRLGTRRVSAHRRCPRTTPQSRRNPTHRAYAV